MLSDRCRRFLTAALKIVVPTVVATFIAGCAISVFERPIIYVPQENVQPTKGADAIPVEVKVEDLQAAPTPSSWSPRYLFTTQDRYFRVKDAADTIERAAETELSARGFKIGSGGALVRIRLTYFEASYEVDPWGPTTVRAFLSMQVQVRPQTGKVLYSREVRGEGAPISEAFMWHPATHELERSLSDALKRLFSDPAFTAAILATRQPPPSKPAGQSSPYLRRLRHNVATLMPSISAASSSVIACSRTTSMWRRSICSSVWL
jgi:Uncharacterized lipoprotein